MTSALYSVRPPETKWEYNNFAYGAAGLLVQKISDTEYEKYIVEHILKPLGMTTAHPVYPSPEMVERMALPYGAGGSLGKPEPVAQVHFDVYPAGDLYMTPRRHGPVPRRATQRRHLPGHPDPVGGVGARDAQAVLWRNLWLRFLDDS
jgi:CubicO group peptidase (beta-lactamase class C family)